MGTISLDDIVVGFRKLLCQVTALFEQIIIVVRKFDTYEQVVELFLKILVALCLGLLDFFKLLVQ